MIYFRYFSSHNAILTLRDKLLKTSKVSSLNDPFEFEYTPTGTMTFGKARKILKLKLNNQAFYEKYRKRNPSIRNRRDFVRFWKTNLHEHARRYAKDFNPNDIKKRQVLARLASDRRGAVAGAFRPWEHQAILA